MKPHVVRRARRLTALFLTAAAAGCASAAPPSPELLARCTKDYAVWFRYHNTFGVNQAGQRMRAELALYRCQQGEYHPSIEILEDMLRRGGFNI